MAQLMDSLGVVQVCAWWWARVLPLPARLPACLPLLLVDPPHRPPLATARQVEANASLPYDNSAPPGMEDALEPVFPHAYGIIGGQPAPEGRHRYMASLRLPADLGGDHFCGAGRGGGGGRHLHAGVAAHAAHARIK